MTEAQLPSLPLPSGSGHAPGTALGSSTLLLLLGVASLLVGIVTAHNDARVGGRLSLDVLFLGVGVIALVGFVLLRWFAAPDAGEGAPVADVAPVAPLGTPDAEWGASPARPWEESPERPPELPASVPTDRLAAGGPATVDEAPRWTPTPPGRAGPAVAAPTWTPESATAPDVPDAAPSALASPPDPLPAPVAAEPPRDAPAAYHRPVSAEEAARLAARANLGAVPASPTVSPARDPVPPTVRSDARVLDAVNELERQTSQLATVIPALPPRAAERNSGASDGPHAGVNCTSCGRDVVVQTNWRKCADCGSPLCGNCLLTSIRVHGRALCQPCIDKG